MKFWFFIGDLFDYSDYNRDFLAMHYCADIELVFKSVAHISRDDNYGFLLRYLHANEASMFFYVFIYILVEECIMVVIPNK